MRETRHSLAVRRWVDTKMCCLRTRGSFAFLPPVHQAIAGRWFAHGSVEIRISGTGPLSYDEWPSSKTTNAVLRARSALTPAHHTPYPRPRHRPHPRPLPTSSTPSNSPCLYFHTPAISLSPRSLPGQQAAVSAAPPGNATKPPPVRALGEPYRVSQTASDTYGF